MDLINQNIESMSLLPPHCPMNPQGYASFFNTSNKLECVAPYKLIIEKHKKDDKPVSRLEYNNFYKDWKQDALKWYPRNADMENLSNTEGINNPSSSRAPLVYDSNLEMYMQTKRKEQFAVPLETNGTNQIGILFNDKCTNSTFNYKRYAAQPVNKTKWFNNGLYNHDITQETEEQKAQYMNQIVQNGMDLYSSVFEDMYILSKPSGNFFEAEQGQELDDNLDYMRKAY